MKISKITASVISTFTLSSTRREIMSHDNNGTECKAQIKRFVKMTGTKTDEWIAGELRSNQKIVDRFGNERYEFSLKDIEKFQEKTPYFDYLEQTNPQRLANLKAEHIKNRSTGDRKQIWWESCQYCGHGIIDPFYIKHEGKKLYMIIGSKCIKGFKNVDDFVEQINKRKEMAIREFFPRWKQNTSNHIFTDRRLAQYVSKDGKRQKPKQKFLSFYKRIKYLDADKSSLLDLIAALRKVKDLEHIPDLPKEIEEIVHPILSKEEKQGAWDDITKENPDEDKKGLDDFFD